MITEFAHETQLQLQYYVYALVDPRSHEIFYVGKGSGNRVFDHEKERGVHEKNDRIDEILANGLEVEKYIVHSGMSEEAAFAAEAALLNLCNGSVGFKISPLTNVQIGHGVIVPCISVDEYDRKFSGLSLTREDFNPADKIMLVNIVKMTKRDLTDPEKLKAKVKIRGRIKEKEEMPKCLFAVFRSVIVDTFEVDDWKVLLITGIKERRYFECTGLVRNQSLYDRYHHAVVSDLIKPYSNQHSRKLF